MTNNSIYVKDLHPSLNIPFGFGPWHQLASGTDLCFCTCSCWFSFLKLIYIPRLLKPTTTDVNSMNMQSKPSQKSHWSWAGEVLLTACQLTSGCASYRGDQVSGMIGIHSLCHPGKSVVGSTLPNCLGSYGTQEKSLAGVINVRSTVFTLSPNLFHFQSLSHVLMALKPKNSLQPWNQRTPYSPVWILVIAGCVQ